MGTWTAYSASQRFGGCSQARQLSWRPIRVLVRQFGSIYGFGSVLDVLIRK